MSCGIRRIVDGDRAELGNRASLPGDEAVYDLASLADTIIEPFSFKLAFSFLPLEPETIE